MNRLPHESDPTTSSAIRLLVGCTRCGRRLVDVPQPGTIVARPGTFAIASNHQVLDLMCRDCAESFAADAGRSSSAG